MLATAVLAFVVCAGIYCVLVVIAARLYLAQPRPVLRQPAPVSVLRPLAGADEGLEENLRSYFRQRYPEFEILAAVRAADDPARPVFEKVRAEFPDVAARLIVTGEPPYPNAKVFSLAAMLAAARYDLIVMADSDTRAAPDTLQALAAEFEDPHLGVATCPYRAVPGPSFWSLLEALGMNTEFLAGLFVARMLEGVRFAVGPTIAARRQALEAIGGFQQLKDYLAEDFMMGKLAAEAGWSVILSRTLIEHHIGAQPFAANFRHRLRWARSTRRSRPLGYLGQLFTYPLPLALIALAVAPSCWPAALVVILLRAIAAWATAGWVLRDPLTARRWFLLPLQDIFSFLFWWAGLFGNKITWRGRRYCLLRDGRFELCVTPEDRRSERSFSERSDKERTKL